jgi:hypothetical protein
MKAAHRLSNKRVAARAVRSPERSAAASCATGPPEGWSSTATDHDEHTPTVDTVLGRGRVRPGRAPQPGLLERQAESRLNVRSAPQPPVQGSTSRTNLLAGSAIEFVVIRAWRAHVDPSTSGAVATSPMRCAGWATCRPLMTPTPPPRPGPRASRAPNVLKQQERISAGRNFDALTTGLGTCARTGGSTWLRCPIPQPQIPRNQATSR